jgi:tetraacyldisaccharide 4'-kinase
MFWTVLTMYERLWKKTIDNSRLSLWSIPAFGLWLVSLVYRVLVFLKIALTRETVRLPVPVLSVGNITVGGSGKTPLVEFLGRDLLRDGFRVGIVSSGYGRPEPVSFVEPGYRVQKMDAGRTGDEVMYLANNLSEAVFAVDRSKATAAVKLTQAHEVDIVIVDDGFQHFSLDRDLNLVTYDAAVKKHMLRMFPRGILREPLRALRRADVVVLTRTKFATDLNRLMQRLQSIHPSGEYYHAQFNADALVGLEQRHSVKYLEDKSVFLFAGVGNFRALRRQVAALAADVDCALELSDHQHYDMQLLQRIKAMADEADSDLILTTGKDWVKVTAFDFGREIYYLNQHIDLDPGEEKLIAYVKQKLGLVKRNN